MRTPKIILLCLLALALASCSPPQPQAEVAPGAAPLANDAVPQVRSQTALPSLTEVPINTEATPVHNFLDSSNTPAPAAADPFINLAKQDLAERLKINTALISALKTIEITWADISKGCTPVPGQILSKGKTTGYRIWLQANGEAYVYHIGLNNQIVLCPKLIPGANNPLLMTPNGSPQAPQDQSP